MRKKELRTLSRRVVTLTARYRELQESTAAAAVNVDSLKSIANAEFPDDPNERAVVSSLARQARGDLPLVSTDLAQGQREMDQILKDLEDATKVLRAAGWTISTSTPCAPRSATSV